RLPRGPRRGTARAPAGGGFRTCGASLAHDNRGRPQVTLDAASATDKARWTGDPPVRIIDRNSVPLRLIGNGYGNSSAGVPDRRRRGGQLHAGGGEAADRAAVAEPADQEAGARGRTAA